MVDKIEMSLDDIIKTNKIGFRRGRGATGAKKPAGGASGKPQRNNTANNAKKGGTGASKFRGTANRQIGKAKGPRTPTTFRTATPNRKFTRVRETKQTQSKSERDDRDTRAYRDDY